MFNFLKNLFKPKNIEGPHPLDGPIRAAHDNNILLRSPPPLPVVQEQKPEPVVEKLESVPVVTVDLVSEKKVPEQTLPVKPPMFAEVELPTVPVKTEHVSVVIPSEPLAAWPFPTSRPEPTVVVLEAIPAPEAKAKGNKPRKPRVSKTVAMNSQSKKKK